MDLLTPEQEEMLEKLQGNKVFQMAVQNSYNHIIITDPNGIVLYANHAAVRITGYDQEEIIGNSPKLWGQVMPPEFYAKLWKTIKEDRIPFIGKLKNKRKNGEIYDAHVTISPIVGDEGELVGFIGIEEDIAMKLAEEGQ